MMQCPKCKDFVDDERNAFCPNCGAPVEINASAKCPYCGSVITLEEHGFALNAIRGISQQTRG